jgi:hypothetical protein
MFCQGPEAGEPAAPVGLAVRPVRGVMPQSTPVPPLEAGASRVSVPGARGPSAEAGRRRSGSSGGISPRNRMSDSKLAGFVDFRGRPRGRGAVHAAQAARAPEAGSDRARRTRSPRTDQPRPCGSTGRRASRPGARLAPSMQCKGAELLSRFKVQVARCRGSDADRGSLPRSASRRFEHHDMRCYRVASSRRRLRRSAAASSRPAIIHTRGLAKTGTPQIVRWITLQKDRPQRGIGP